MNIYPAILTGSPLEAQTQIAAAAALPEVQTVHIDIIDGQFVENVTITPADLAAMRFGPVNCDLHLLTEEPLDFVYEAIEHKKNLPIRTIFGQIERMSYQDHFLETVAKHNWQAGLALDLYTPIEEIEPESWNQIQGIIIMGIEAGWQGRPFNPEVFEKIKDITSIRRQLGREFEIIVDGGMTPQVVQELQEYAIDGVAVGSALWQSEDLKLAFNSFREVA